MATLRLATPEDAQGIAHVHIDTWLSTYRGLMPDDLLARLSLDEKTARWEANLHQPNRMSTLVAVQENAVVGFASFGPEPGNDYRYQGELYALYVLDAHQRKGIGRELVLAAAHGLLKRGFPNMMVWVLSTNPARQFYEKLGGQYLRDRTVDFNGSLLHEAAYGWPELKTLVQERS